MGRRAHIFKACWRGERFAVAILMLSIISFNARAEDPGPQIALHGTTAANGMTSASQSIGQTQAQTSANATAAKNATSGISSNDANSMVNGGKAAQQATQAASDSAGQCMAQAAAALAKGAADQLANQMLAKSLEASMCDPKLKSSNPQDQAEGAKCKASSNTAKMAAAAQIAASMLPIAAQLASCQQDKKEADSMKDPGVKEQGEAKQDPAGGAEPPGGSGSSSPTIVSNQETAKCILDPKAPGCGSLTSKNTDPKLPPVPGKADLNSKDLNANAGSGVAGGAAGSGLIGQGSDNIDSGALNEGAKNAAKALAGKEIGDISYDENNSGGAANFNEALAGPVDQTGLGPMQIMNGLERVQADSGRSLTLWQLATRRFQGEKQGRLLFFARIELVRAKTSDLGDKTTLSIEGNRAPAAAKPDPTVAKSEAHSAPKAASVSPAPSR